MLPPDGMGETGPVVEVDYAYVSVGTYYAVTTIYLYIKLLLMRAVYVAHMLPVKFYPFALSR